MKSVKRRLKTTIPSGKETYISEETVSHDAQGHEGHDGHRPRNLGVLDSLFHLDADWGTSLAYILPLSLSLTGRVAPLYMIIISFIMFVVANGYKVICKHNPDGGGVYSSLKKVNKFMAVVGALLLITDYIVTQALSVTDAFHYLQLEALFEHGGALSALSPLIVHNAVPLWTTIILILLTIINWRGPHFSAKFAGIASASTFLLALPLAVIALPLVPQGLMNMGHFNESIFNILRNTTAVLLALSGVEAISNMTGIMKDPEATSRKALNIELVKVIFTTLVLGIAMNALPPSVAFEGHTDSATGQYIIEQGEVERIDFGCVSAMVSHRVRGEEYECPKHHFNKARPDMLVAMAEYLVHGRLGQIYGLLIGLAYGLLLIFAGNTALIDITNVTYSLARDNELPEGFTRLNKKYGVPIWGLITAGVMPIIVIWIVGAEIEVLAALYAIGVVSAVSLNLAGTTLQVQGRERLVTGFGAVIMSILLVVLIFNKMEATFFAMIVVTIGLSARAVQKYFMRNVKHGIEPALQFANVEALGRGHVLVPVYDEYDENFFEFVASYAKKIKEDVVLLYLHEVDTVLERNAKHPKVNREAKSFIGRAKSFFERAGVAVHPVFEFTDEIGDTINHYRRTLAPSATFITPHEQSKIMAFLKGDVTKKVLSRRQSDHVLIYSKSS